MNRDQNQSQVTIPPEQQLFQMLRGAGVARGIAAVAELGVADLIGDRTVPVAEIARSVSSHEGALYRLLRALASVGVFKALPERRFENSPLSNLLRSDRIPPMRDVVRWVNSAPVWQAWGRLDISIATGRCSFEEVTGTMIFDYLAKDPALGVVFDGAMTTFSAASTRAVVSAYDFSTATRVVDVGGGQGALLQALVTAHPTLFGVLFDRPEVLQRVALPKELASRVELQSGSFFERVPSGADLYILKSVLHDWDDERCIQILANCAAALPAGGKLLVIEALIADTPDSAAVKFMDLDMLVMTRGGRERERDEFAALFERAGLQLARVLPTQSMQSLLEVVKR